MQRFRNRFSCFGASDRQWNASLATDVSVPSIPPGLTCRWCQLDSFSWLPPCLVGTRLMPNAAKMKCTICVTHPKLLLQQHKDPHHIETKIQFDKTPFSSNFVVAVLIVLLFRSSICHSLIGFCLLFQFWYPYKPCNLLEIWDCCWRPRLNRELESPSDFRSLPYVLFRWCMSKGTIYSRQSAVVRVWSLLDPRQSEASKENVLDMTKNGHQPQTNSVCFS